MYRAVRVSAVDRAVHPETAGHVERGRLRVAPPAQVLDWLVKVMRALGLGTAVKIELVNALSLHYYQQASH